LSVSLIVVVFISWWIETDWFKAVKKKIEGRGLLPSP
jgi:hypothetical protein